MSRRHHHHLQPYDYDRFADHSRDRDREARGIEYQDDSLSSINSDEDGYLHHHKDKKSLFFPKNETSGNKNPKVEKSSTSENFPKEMKGVQQVHQYGENSDGTTQRLARLETMLEELIKRNNPPKVPPAVSSSSTTTSEKTSKDRRSQFSLEPRRHNFTTSMWINKIQEVSIQNNWDEKTTISYMGTQMSGIIKAWYNCLPNYEYTWPEWKILISKMFPDNTDFVTSLKRLVTRLKQADETMATYYFSKMYLIECCKITGEDAVSCLIDGLNNQSIQEQAKSQNFLTPETLYSRFLMVLPEYTVDYAPAVPATAQDSVLNNWYYQEEDNVQPLIENQESFEYEKPRGGGGGEEFDFRPPPQDFEEHSPLQKRPIHARLDKRFIKPNNKNFKNKLPLAAKVCSICKNRGHLARNCRTVKKLMRCKLAGEQHSTSLYKKCTIGGRVFDGFVDTGCTTVTIKEGVAKILKLDVRGRSFLEVFGGSTIEVKGETNFEIQADGVSARVRAVVVPDDVQDVDVIIGQEYLKNVCAVLQNSRLKFFELTN